MKEYIIGGLIGAVAVFVILKIIAAKPKDTKESKTMSNLLVLAKTPEASKLITSKEFSNLMKTEAFKKFATDFGTEQLVNFITL